MKGLELIQKYPLAGKIVKDWFLKEMINSFKDETVPTEFKDFMLEQGVDDDKIGTLIDVNPRMLFDVFDENEIYITIKVVKTSVQNSMKPTFLYKINDTGEYTNRYFIRKEAELFAIEAAFEILENLLSPKEEEIN